MKVLSVDWDYFFKDTTPYDWQMNENSPLYYELIWQISRGSGRNLFTGEKAIEVMVPNESYKTFWDKQVDSFTSDMQMFVCESHSVIDSLFKQLKIKRADVVNFDAHHDCGYGGNKEFHCGSWVYHGKKSKYINNYTLVYPEWRKETNYEAEYNIKPDSVVYEINKQYYDMIFVCRSSCWTPPWADQQWLEFIKPLLDNCAIPLSNPVNDDGWITRCRNFDKEAAIAQAKQIEDMMKKHQEVMKNA